MSAGARKYASLIYLKKLVEAAIEETNLPIVLHLYHGDSFGLCKSCIEEIVRHKIRNVFGSNGSAIKFR